MRRAKNDDLIYGIHPLNEAMEAGMELDMILVNRNPNPALREIVQRARELNIAVKQVPKEKLDRTVRKEHQGVIGFLNKVPNDDLDELLTRAYERGETPLILIADGVTDVRNIGAMARSAECLGAHALVVPTLGSARLGSDAIKSSAGALLRVAVCRSNSIKDSIACCHSHGLSVVGISEKGTSQLSELKLNIPVALVMGDEHDGISQGVLRVADSLALIPMHGNVGSLNVSVATGIALYEVSRQRRI